MPGSKTRESRSYPNPARMLTQIGMQCGNGVADRTVLVKLVSTAGTGFFYTTTKVRTAERKIARMKYDPRVNQHVLFTEQKIK
ncbi:hypothetical protein PtA15_6A225 [Puccinia triticina]|uniref:50S ribosomal protein L33 n=1 Tax=Puccinia triticina TaxID=208348 RepID=A0ABY7CM87_9BASI|nr:uncharacterized protein PtA15_6A225 [Puccinia triticina]WAQ85597.1 hypothetical protein PtA15_6A225 [Puccinia triticina]